MNLSRTLSIALVLGSCSVLLAGCEPPNPIISTEDVYSTKLAGERLLGEDEVVNESGRDTAVFEGNYRDIELVSITHQSPRQLIFTEQAEDSIRLSRSSLSTQEQLIADVPQVQHVTPLEDGSLLYMIPDLSTHTWKVKKLAQTTAEPLLQTTNEQDADDIKAEQDAAVPSDKDAELLYEGKIESVLKRNKKNLVYIIDADEEYQVFVNAEQVWQYPDRIIEFVYDSETTRHAALVQKGAANAFLIKTSFIEIEEEYSRAHGIRIDGDKLSFFGQTTDTKWFWYIDGEKIPWAPELETDRLNEVISVARKGKHMWALVSMRNAAESGTGNNVIRRTYAINSKGEQTLLPGEPSKLIDTKYGWKTVIALASRGGYQVYNISKDRVEDEASEIQIIGISPATDIWYVKREAGYSLWNLHRGDGSGGDVLDYIEPIQRGEQTHLLVERSSGAVQLLTVEP